ncbi:hypothetical protein PLICRDRAFT_702303 [Plicaturopsis crispa FD-325 SS-3]|uniref:Enoyl reductase (ER) domain-containing protein n=1 Tax=Plicaturopsis crispa FD-325 SS-3 TaxID=944288 RepID=A0A0C9T6N3_PLICR|nr:hypothetical protein PLICRDRAFT_702303 [Plicaturopsis crispa FD-325 SS-3]
MAASTFPQKQKGVWFARDGCTLREFDVTQPGPGEVLVQNVAVASNPKDWKVTRLWYDKLGWEGIEGNDVAGYVAAVGEGVTEFKLGDRVAAFTKMGQPHPKWGGYQQYSTAPAGTTFPLGPSTSFEAAATLPLALATAFIGLYRSLGLPAFTDTAGREKEKVRGTPILVYGASSSVGAYAVQLAKLSGMYVVGVAGGSKEYARSVGADVVVDYRGKTREEVGNAVAEALEGRGPLHYVYNAVATPETNQISVDVLRKDGGKLTHSHEWPESVDVPPNVEHIRTGVWTVHGEDAEFATAMYCAIAPLVESGAFKPNRVRLVPGGLTGVPQGVEMLAREEEVYTVENSSGAGAKLAVKS